MASNEEYCRGLLNKSLYDICKKAFPSLRIREFNWTLFAQPNAECSWRSLSVPQNGTWACTTLTVEGRTFWIVAGFASNMSLAYAAGSNAMQPLTRPRDFNLYPMFVLCPTDPRRSDSEFFVHENQRLYFSNGQELAKLVE